jgi:hypothetical protein
MPKKSFQKKKAYQAKCQRRAVKDGEINLADGRWVPQSDRQVRDDSMKRDFISGYRCGR